jgi:hypothetical protein
VRTGNYTKFFYIDKVKDLEKKMKIDDGTYNDDEQEQKKNSGLNKDLSNVNSSKLTTGG